jgi:uncharacterized protein (TIGR03086 family)
MTDLIDPVTALERSYEELATVVSGLGPDQLTAPTCCPDWDVRALLNHILGGAQMYNAANDGRLVAEDAGDIVGDDPRRAVAAAATANIRSWQEPGALDGERTYPFGTFPAGAGLISNVGEVALHAWDLASATRQPARIDKGVATLVLDFYQYVPMDELRAHGVYGPEIAVSETASVQDRLLGFLSREPS